MAVFHKFALYIFSIPEPYLYLTCGLVLPDFSWETALWHNFMAQLVPNLLRFRKGTICLNLEMDLWFSSCLWPRILFYFTAFHSPELYIPLIYKILIYPF
jgi:hypothetical protein